MNEEQIALLKSLGYTINEFGGIISPEGEYLDKVDYEGTVIESFQTRDEYNDMVAREQQLKNIGFEANPESQDNLETQKMTALAKNKIKAYQENPTEEPTPDWLDPYTKQAFDELQGEQQQQLGAAYLTPDAMQESLEEDTIFSELDSIEDKNKLKEINKKIKFIEEKDADVDAVMTHILNEERDPNRNIFEKGGDALWDGIYSLIRTFTPSGVGMDNEKLKEKYFELKAERKKLMMPIAQRKLEKTGRLLEQLRAEREETDFWTTTNDQYAFAITMLENQENNLKDYIDGDNLDSNIFSVNNAADWASLGLYDALIGTRYLANIKDKIEEGEELTASEMAIAKAHELVGSTQKEGFQQNFWHEVSGGTNESLKFLGYGTLGRTAGRGVSKMTGRYLSGTANTVVGTTGSLLTQAALHPHTYKYAFERYAGDFEFREDEQGNVELLAGSRLYNTLMTENEQFIEMMENNLAIAKENGDLKQIAEIKDAIQKAEDYGKSIKAPTGMSGSLAYGFTEVLKENLAEQYGGKLYGAVGLKRIENLATQTKLGKAVFNNKLTKGLNDMTSYGKDILNRNFGGVPGTKLIGSNTEEIFEEILVQATPSVGQSWEEYKQQVGELGKADFYAKVAAQTMLMQKTFQGAGMAKKYYDIANLDASERAKRKEYAKLYKEMGNRNMSQSDFNKAMMKAGEGNFSIQEYSNVINELRSKGLVQEANRIEQEKIYNQALVAQKYGQLKEFQKAMNKAKYNKNLSPDTIGVIEQIRGEINEMVSDDNQYINSSEVIGMKSKRRYAQKTLADLESEKNKLDYGKINDEVDGILQKLGIEDTYATVDKQNPALNDYFKKNFDKLSEELQLSLTLNSQVAESQKVVDKYNDQIKKITSYDHQTMLMNQQDYFKYIDGINRKVFNGKMTPAQFQKIISKIPKSKQKGIPQKRIDEIHKQVQTVLEIEARKKQTTVPKQEVKETTKPETVTSTTPEVVPETEENGQPEPTQTQMATQSVMENVVLQTSEQVAQEENLADPFDTENDVDIVNNDSIDFLPSDSMSNQFSEWSRIYESENESKPTFNDFFNEAVESVDGDKSAFNKNTIKFMGESWEAAGLGKSNWEKIYKDNYTSRQSVMKNIITQVLAENDETKTKPENVNSSTQETETKKAEPASGVNPMTGEAIKVTPVMGKTLVTTPKANYNALDYANKKEIQEQDGKKVIIYTKEDTNEIPTLNTDSFVDVKALLHPDKNNPGDKWKVNISNEADWGADNLMVSVTQSNGEITEYISFSEWIKRNKPSNMTLEEFQQTDAYIGKVPMYYSDNEGNNVAFIPDTDWYSPLTVRDGSKSIGDVVELDNPTDHHKKAIQEGKENTMAMRKAIVEGRVKEVTITSKNGSPFIRIPEKDRDGNAIPPKKLSEVAKDNPIVFFKGDYFVDLDGVPMDNSKIEIVNLDEIKRQKGITNSTFYLSPINKTDKKTRYVAINVLRKNEKNQNMAMSEDVQTAKWIMAANAVLNRNKPGYNLSLEQAESIRNQIRQLTGIDLRNFDNAINLTNSLIALQKDNKKYTANSKNIPLPNGKTGYFIDALFFGDFIPVQNTNLLASKSAGLSVKQKGDIFEVKKIGETYEDFLRERLTTNIMGYNMGTEENPAFTHSVQPIIKVEAQEVEVQESNITTVTENKEVTESPDAAKAIADAQALLESINGFEGLDDADYLLPTLTDTNSLKKGLNLIPGLSLDQQSTVVNYVLSLISSNYDNSKEMTVGEFNDMIAAQFSNRFGVLKSKLEKQYENLSKLYEQDSEKNQRLQPVMDVLQKNIARVDKVTSNYAKFFEKAYMEGMRSGFIPSSIKTTDELRDELLEHNEEEMYVKDHSKSSNEVIHKDKISKKLRRLFSTITNGETGFLGIDKHEGYDTMYNTIATILISPLPANPTFDAMMERLDRFNNTYPWLQPLTTELKKADDDIKASFVSNMYKYAAKAKFVAFTDQANGMESALWFSNANNIQQKIKESWNNNFRRSNVTNGNTINTEKLSKLYDQWTSWGDNKHQQSDDVLRQWLYDFGISLSDGTWQELKDGKFVTGRGKKTRTLSFEDLFFDSGNRLDRLFSNLANYAKQYKDAKQGTLNYVDNSKLHPFNDMNNIFKSLIPMEAGHNTSLMNITRRDGDKTVSEIIFPSFFFNNVRKLIQSAQGDKSYLEDLAELKFSSNSVILDLLQNSAEFADIFEYGEVGLMAMKRLYNRNPMFSKIDQLSPVDYMFHQRTMFQYQKVENLKVDKHGFDMRVAHMSTPTNSDKGRMMLMKTAVYNLYSNPTAFQKNEKGKYVFSDEVKELLYESLIVPELRRIISHKDTNIKDYNKGAIRFNLIPEINTMMSGDNQTVLEFLSTNKDEVAFKEKFFTKITGFLEESIYNEADNNHTSMIPYMEDGGKTDKFNNNEYLATRNTKDETAEEKAFVAELDYVINSMISNMNTLQLIAGDPAMYYKSKGEPSSIDTAEQIQISRDLGINLGKRMALMIAPGIVLNDAQDETYLQLFLEDQEEVAQNAEEIIKWHYGNGALNETFNDKTYQEHINDLRNKNISKENLDQLKLKFAKVANFLQIETTDAQEYTTVAEHLRVLQGIGRISQSQVDDINDKIEKGQSLEKKDLDLVLQPLKPVYTGDILDKEQGVRRIMYVKSSSFPLVPDLVRGTKLEPLMNKMMQIEKDQGVHVRASYQSANKVGAMSSAVNPFNQESLDSLDELNTETGRPLNAVEMNRIDFKIQQDVPFKSDYQKEDKVSMGTQIFKLLFGDGITDIPGFRYKGETMTGKELQQEFFNTFSSMIGIQKDKLLDSLGLDDDYTTDNPEYAAEKIQELLVSEAEERGFSENDIKALEIQKKTINGKDVYHFKLPLWFSGNSNKFESMLNAIINNKIFKQKLPGNGFVVGSEAGLQIETQGERVINDVVYIGDYNGGELKGTEVLAPSKIKVDGKLIDLFEKDKNGNLKYILPAEEGKGFKINPEAIDPALFENFTFRTPTSSHGSGSNIKIVGFIPAVMGDLLITPKNFVTQMGQDFDIDKLTAYQYHHINNNGRIEKLNESHKEEAIQRMKAKFLKRDLDEGAGGINEIMADDLLVAIFGQEELDLALKLDTDAAKISSLERAFDLKLAQNDFIEIHNSVYTNQDARVQTKINKVLSMDFAEQQADAIDAMNTTNDKSTFNILSPTYQMNKLISGSTGSLAIGIYAKGVTFNSMAQQADRPVQLLELNEELEPVPANIRIGNIVSDGTLGLRQTISKSNANSIEKQLVRNTAEVQDERVNTATDNEKAQILGRVGITHLDAVAVDNLLSLLGIDAEVNQINKVNYDETNPFHRTAIIDGEQVYYEEFSIPYLLHSQPIVKEYFTRLKNAKAILNGFVSSKVEEDIINDLLGEYDRQEGYSEKFTGQNLIDEIKNNNIESDFQKEVLVLYRRLIQDAKEMKKLQDVIDMSNLGKSMWQLQDNIEKFINITQNNNFININSLIGEFSNKEGELDLGGIYFTPTTNQGAMIGTALSLGRNLFFKYFPYYDDYLNGNNGIIPKIIKLSGYSGNEVQFKETIFQEIKKFITAASRNNLFLGTPSEERKSLFMDTEENQSLSTYLANIFNSTDTSKGVNIVKNNALLSYLSYERGEMGKPSLIKFDNTEIANVSEEHFHSAFKELFVQNVELPNKNGQPYTTRELAQELVAYSHLSGGIVREAIEFHRFIPIEYYDSLEHPKANNVTRALQNYDTLVSNWADKDRLKNFTEQFFQNNPEYGTQLPKDFKKVIKGSELWINEQLDEYPKYVSVKNKTKEKLKQSKWSLYKLVNGNYYQEIDVLGEFGMAEYDYDNSNMQTIIEKPKPVEATPGLEQSLANVPPSSQPTGFSISNADTVMGILSKIKNNTIAYNPTLSDIAGELMTMFQDKAMDLQIELVNDSELPFKGRHSNGTITMNMAHRGTMAETFLHEFVHGVTVSGLKPYFSNDWNTLNDNAPKEVMQLNILFNEFKNQVQKKYPDEYNSFLEKMKDYRDNIPVGFTQRELSLFYPTVNIKEFLAVSLSNNQDFIAETSQMTYKKTSMNIFDRFKKVLDALLKKFSGVENNLAEQILGTSLATVQVLNTNRPKQEVSTQDMQEFKHVIKQDDIFGPPLDQYDDNLGDPDTDTTDGPADVSLLPDNIKPCK